MYEENDNDSDSDNNSYHQNEQNEENEENEKNEQNEQNEHCLIQLAVEINDLKFIREINAAIYDSQQRIFFVTQFQENENFSNFESFLFQVNHHNDYAKYSLMINFPRLPAEKGIL